MADKIVRFAVFIYDDVEPIDIGATFGVLSMAKRVAPHIELFTVSELSGAVRLTNDLMVGAQYGFDDCPEFDAIIVNGGPGWEAQVKNTRTLEFLQRSAANKIVSAVCTGGLILAAAGLLDGLPATTKKEVTGTEHSPLELLASGYPAIDVKIARLVDAGSVITGGGVCLGIDVTLHLIAKTLGEQIASETARIIEYTAALQANEQRMNTVVI